MSFVRGITKWQFVKNQRSIQVQFAPAGGWEHSTCSPPAPCWQRCQRRCPISPFPWVGGERRSSRVLPFAFTSPPPLVKPVGIHSICPTDLKLAEETRDPAGAPLHKGLLPGEHTKTSWPGAGGRQRLVPGHPREVFSLRRARRRLAQFSVFLLLFV